MGIRDFGAGEISKRTLEFIWLLDCSTSMKGDKIESLNQAIRETIPEMRRMADENPEAEVYMRVITYSTDAVVHINRTKLDDFTWEDVSAKGRTCLSKAYDILIDILDVEKMSNRCLRPVIVLISDGAPATGWKSKLNILKEMPWMIKSIKVAIGIGTNFKEESLEKFVNNNEIGILRASNASDLINYIKWASTSVLSVTSISKSTTDGKLNIPQPDLSTKVISKNIISVDTPF